MFHPEIVLLLRRELQLGLHDAHILSTQDRVLLKGGGRKMGQKEEATKVVLVQKVNV